MRIAPPSRLPPTWSPSLPPALPPRPGRKSRCCLTLGNRRRPNTFGQVGKLAGSCRSTFSGGPSWKQSERHSEDSWERRRRLPQLRQPARSVWGESAPDWCLPIFEAGKGNVHFHQPHPWQAWSLSLKAETQKRETLIPWLTRLSAKAFKPSYIMYLAAWATEGRKGKVNGKV